MVVLGVSGTAGVECYPQKNAIPGTIRKTLRQIITPRFFRFLKWSAAERDKDGNESPDRPGKPIYSHDPMLSFMNYMLYETNPKLKHVVYFHNGGRFDILFAAGTAYEMKRINVDLIARGNRIYRMKVDGGNRSTTVSKLEFRDSWNIIPLALDKLPKTFALKYPDGTPIEPKCKFS